jgi:transposase
MRFSTKQHPFYCGIDLHARTMYACILDQHGEIRLHRNIPARPETCLKAIAPSRDDMVIAVACLFTWYWLADLCAQQGLPCVLGHALSMKAIHGGKATNDTIDSQTIAVLLRGGMLPQASVSPAEMRAPRDLRRRRMPLMRQRADLLAPSQNTHSQDNLPESETKLAYKGTRDGVAERCLDPAVQKSVEVDLALSDHDDRLLSDGALTSVQTAKQHKAPALYRRPSVPGIGKIWRLVLLYEMHDITRFPRVQEGVSSCRLVPWAKESAGKRYGTSGTKIGNASRTWAFSEAAVLFLRNKAQGQKCLARLEQKHGQGQALTILAHKVARAVYYLLTRATVFQMDRFLNGDGSRAGEPAASRDTHGISRHRRPWNIFKLYVIERAKGHRLSALIPRD